MPILSVFVSAIYKFDHQEGQHNVLDFLQVSMDLDFSPAPQSCNS